MIEICNLKKSINNKNILKDISFTIEEGDVFGIIGKSGSGKTTLLDCISGLKSYDSGSISIDGKEISKLNSSEVRSVRKNIGFIFQDFSLLKRRNVLDNIALPMKCWKLDKGLIKEKTLELATLVDLEDHCYKRPKELSGGQQQRVAIARALSLDPQYIICDEFTSALDPSTTNSILNLLMDIKKNSKLTIIVVTHDMNVAKKICNKVVVLEDGQIVDSGYTTDVFSKDSSAVRRLLGKEDDKNE
ncbi:MAG: ATP-binding cassette domain-containing protein [Peptostreptococcus sp.]|uniref:methionine ABC transporter ATP-binding protein n=1 Tax=Peptostreptococcus sp. TaxID=1262 RepID=UPI002FC7C24D